MDVNSLRVAAERLRAYTRSTLVEWVQDKYGAPVSYTRAHNANLWHLTIDPDCKYLYCAVFLHLVLLFYYSQSSGTVHFFSILSFCSRSIC